MKLSPTTEWIDAVRPSHRDTVNPVCRCTVSPRIKLVIDARPPRCYKHTTQEWSPSVREEAHSRGPLAPNGCSRNFPFRRTGTSHARPGRPSATAPKSIISNQDSGPQRSNGATMSSSETARVESWHGIPCAKKTAGPAKSAEPSPTSANNLRATCARTASSASATTTPQPPEDVCSFGAPKHTRATTNLSSSGGPVLPEEGPPASPYPPRAYSGVLSH